MSAFLARHEHRIITVSESGCMIWMGATTRGGYGIVASSKITATGNRRSDGARRQSFESANGPFDAGLHVLHRCDVPTCVNPAHLFLGNASDNMQDMAKKGRGCRGSRHGMAKMTEEQVREIRSAYRFRNVTASQLAEKHGLNEKSVAAAIRGQTWKHLGVCRELESNERRTQ